MESNSKPNSTENDQSAASHGAGVNIQATNVKVGGDIVGRDKVVHGDNVVGSKGVDAKNLSQLFAEIHQLIQERPENPDFEKEELTGKVDAIQKEVEKGDEANPNKLERWLKELIHLAPDIFEVTVASLVNPAAGVTTAIRKIAENASGWLSGVS